MYCEFEVASVRVYMDTSVTDMLLFVTQHCKLLRSLPVLRGKVGHPKQRLKGEMVWKI